MTTDIATPSSLPELQKLIREKYGDEMADLDPTTSMRDKGFDSLALVEFLFAVEDHFKISLPDSDEHIDTLGELAVMVDKLRAEQPAVPVAPASPAPSGSSSEPGTS